MLNIYEIILILVFHFIADYVCQPSSIATTKWTSIKSLLNHVGIYGATMWIVGMVVYCNPHTGNYSIERAELISDFVAIQMILHFITDYFSSKVIHKAFEDKRYGTEFPNIGAFTYMGIDQLIHFSCLFIGYSLFK